MSNTKHTPGPWDIGYGDSSNAFGVFTKEMLDNGSMDTPVCLISPKHSVNETDKANAKLIAAAPELLEALKVVTDQLTVFCDMDVTNKSAMNDALELSKAAIKKATE